MLKTYEGNDIRNVGLAGHLNCGKTTLAAGLLYLTGATNRLTRVDEGNTVTDFDEEEIGRKITISTAVAHAEWKKTKLNLLDTPGFNIFINDTRSALVAADSALVVVDGVAGVEVQTEKVWEIAGEYHLPRVLVINKLDRERSSFDSSVAAIVESFGPHCVPVQLPIGGERDFCGVIDLIEMKAYEYTPNGNGKGTEIPIPAGMAEAARKAHAVLVEAVAEGEDALMEEFFETGTLAAEHVRSGIDGEMRAGAIFPILCCSALLNIGTDLVADFIAEHLPSAIKRTEMIGTQDGHEEKRLISDSEHASIYVFKTTADAFAGRMSYFKVMSGVIANDSHIINSRNGTDERLAHIACPMGKSMAEVKELHAGDIGVVAKLKDTMTGDTLAEKGFPIVYPPVILPEPSIAYAVSARTRQDEDRMGNALARVLEEDTSLRFYRDQATNEFLLAGCGQQHVEIVVSRLKKRYNVDVELKAPKIPYRETIRGSADVHGRHKKQTGGHGQFGDCRIRMAPLPRGEKFKFVNSIFGGAIPRQFVPAVEKGIVEAAERGYLAGYPVVDFQIDLYDGSYHDVDSNEMSFKMAGRKAFKLAMEQARPALLEPIMNVEVVAPNEYAGDLMGDFNSRRGRVGGMDTRGNMQVIRAQVPMAEMLTYANDLISMTQGRASYAMEFDHYDFVPQPQAEKIIAAARASGAGKDEEDE